MIGVRANCGPLMTEVRQSENGQIIYFLASYENVYISKYRFGAPGSFCNETWNIIGMVS